MDVDAATVGEGPERPNWRERGNSLSEVERKKRQSEGRRFLCGRQGHIRRNCPRKNIEGRSGKGEGREERARAVTVEGRRGEGNQQGSGRSDDDHAPIPPPAYDTESLLNQTRAMSESARESLVDIDVWETLGIGRFQLPKPYAYETWMERVLLRLLAKSQNGQKRSKNEVLPY